MPMRRMQGAPIEPKPHFDPHDRRSWWGAVVIIALGLLTYVAVDRGWTEWVVTTGRPPSDEPGVVPVSAPPPPDPRTTAREMTNGDERAQQEALKSQPRDDPRLNPSREPRDDPRFNPRNRPPQEPMSTPREEEAEQLRQQAAEKREDDRPKAGPASMKP